MDYQYDLSTTSGMDSGMWAFLAAYMVIALIFGLGSYIYYAFAFMTIAKKTNYPTPAIAWIPGIGQLIISASVAKMHWWPILLILVGWIPFVGWIGMVVLAVYSVIWTWKVCEARKKPGWWAILMLIPIVNFIMIGIVAWSD